MSQNDIPAAAAALLRESVHTFEQLEALAFLYRGRGRAWADGAVAAALKIPVEAARAALLELASRGLVASETGDAPRYRCSPATGELETAVAALVGAYDDSRLAVVRLMNENAIHRLRTGAMRAFSDAFLIRRKDRDG